MQNSKQDLLNFQNGSVQLLEDKDEKKASHQDYCFRQINNNETDDITTEVLFCARDNPDDVRMTLYPIGEFFYSNFNKHLMARFADNIVIRDISPK